MLAGGILLGLLALPAALVCLVGVAKNGQGEGTTLADTAPGRPADPVEEPSPARPPGPPQEPPQPRPADAPRAAVPKEVVNSIGMKLVLIPAGKFLMGSPKGEEERQDDEERHEVEITRPFYLGRQEVTLGQFRKFAEDGASGYESRKDVRSPETDEHPVVFVSWTDAKAFCDWLSRKEGKTYRLPTEAEWEYSCRAGSRTRFCFGNDDKELGHYAWYDANAGTETHPVGRKKPNAWGLFDMHGNVWEWCSDRYDENYYKTSPARDPQGPGAGSLRVYRGGSVLSVPRRCRAAFRDCNDSTFRVSFVGFRVVCEQ
jgi:formylglycine-generating enzyme required for sulfatase activity